VKQKLATVVLTGKGTSRFPQRQKEAKKHFDRTWCKPFDMGGAVYGLKFADLKIVVGFGGLLGEKERNHEGIDNGFASAA
jgi:hypothetical protein